MSEISFPSIMLCYFIIFKETLKRIFDVEPICHILAGPALWYLKGMAQSTPRGHVFSLGVPSLVQSQNGTGLSRDLSLSKVAHAVQLQRKTRSAEDTTTSYICSPRANK